ncbi:MAG TPA: preprotein translocase subunit SecA, partial [Pedobacter sp.]
MLGFLTKVFGSKSERDIKAIQPLVIKINEEYAKLSSLSNDELRNKTVYFKDVIAKSLAEIDNKISGLKANAESQELSLPEKTAIYEQIDALTKDRDKELETVLMEILPAAFAVVKETSRRFTENEKLEVTASAYDREYAARRSNVKIEGDKAYWANSWDAAGSTVVWNMVHYDVQLIGGIVLHNGKIAEMA